MHLVRLRDGRWPQLLARERHPPDLQLIAHLLGQLDGLVKARADHPLWQQLTAILIEEEIKALGVERAASVDEGKLSAVEAAIAELPEPARGAARIEWEYSATVRRNQPFVLQLAPALGLDDAALDNLFMVAATK